MFKRIVLNVPKKNIRFRLSILIIWIVLIDGDTNRKVFCEGLMIPSPFLIQI